MWDSSTGALLRTIDLPEHEICSMAEGRSLAEGRDWEWRKAVAVAFAMGHHPRLGVGSEVLSLEAGVVRMILDRA